MPEITAIHIALIAVFAAVAFTLGWLFGRSRAERKKAAINKGWREQLAAKETQQARLSEQVKALMAQVTQLQASGNDAKKRTRELSESVQDAVERRDRLQREIKDVRTNFENAIAERDKLRADINATTMKKKALDKALSERDAVIKKLSAELENWQDRVPPLIERFNERNTEVERLETVVEDLRQRLFELEAEADERAIDGPDPTQTHVEPMRDPDTLTDGRDASNEPLGKVEAKANGADDEDDALDSLRDDLKRIKGVGPAIEKTLNEMGIFRFNQIAEMSEYDIDRVARRLKGFRTRIYREDWIGQARSLRNDKIGD